MLSQFFLLLQKMTGRARARARGRARGQETVQHVGAAAVSTHLLQLSSGWTSGLWALEPGIKGLSSRAFAQYVGGPTSPSKSHSAKQCDLGVAGRGAEEGRGR